MAQSKRTGTCLFVMALAAAGQTSGAMVSGPSQTVNAGGTAVVALSLASGTQKISAVQFDLVWDPTLTVHVVPGAQAGVSDKALFASVLQSGALRCLIAGMNQSALADGELVRLYVTASASATAGSSQITLLNLNAADGNGGPVYVQGGLIAVQIQSGGTIQGIQPTGVLNAASLTAGPISPGEIVTLLGSFAAGSPSVLFNGVPATVLYAGLNQVNAIVPFGLNVSSPAQVEIRQSGTSLETTVPVAAAAPSIFTLSTTGIGPGAILNQDYTVNSPTNPAAPGSVIMVYATGFGALSPLPADGEIAQVLATTPYTVTATIDGLAAAVPYAGAAPTLINGVVQVNLQVPQGAPTNPAAPLNLVMGSFATQPGVTVSIR